MLKKFMYLSIGILALAVAFQMGVSMARSSVDCVIAADAYNGALAVVTSSGMVQG